MSFVPEHSNNTSYSEKLFYRIGEVSRITGLEPYILRYWETEFPFLRPRKSSSGHRIYTRREIDLIFTIKKLLYEEKYTIEGVRKKFGIIKKSGESNPQKDTNDSETRERLKKIKSKLKNILELLNG
ncbi:MAG: MerR family transcriptional regulator [Thermodesulfovibrionales bacterium]|nr:MerR family transcriptional regulator [Thermodesulfovibrionales bacterium]